MVQDKQNVGVVWWTNNQALALGPSHEQRCVCIISKRINMKKKNNSKCEKGNNNKCEKEK